MITNHFWEFCYTFDSKHKKDLCWESTNSQDQNVPIENAPSQIYSCWSPRVSKKKKIHSLTTRSWHVTIDLQRVSTLLWVDPILPVSFGVSRVQNFLTGEGRMSRIPTSFIFIAKGRNDHLKREENQTKKQNTPQRSYSIRSSFRVIIR